MFAFVVLDNLKYATSHEWVRVEGDVAYVGITDHAQVCLCLHVSKLRRLFLMMEVRSTLFEYCIQYLQPRLPEFFTLKSICAR